MSKSKPQRHGREACRGETLAESVVRTTMTPRISSFTGGIISFPFSLDLSIRLEALGAMLFRQLFD